MKAERPKRPPLAERIKAGLREGIEAARGERDLVETIVEVPESAKYVTEVRPKASRQPKQRPP